eukprot:2463703-Rhodomonas_salina.4
MPERGVLQEDRRLDLQGRDPASAVHEVPARSTDLQSGSAIPPDRGRDFFVRYPSDKRHGGLVGGCRGKPRSATCTWCCSALCVSSITQLASRSSAQLPPARAAMKIRARKSTEGARLPQHGVQFRRSVRCWAVRDGDYDSVKRNFNACLATAMGFACLESIRELARAPGSHFRVIWFARCPRYACVFDGDFTSDAVEACCTIHSATDEGAEVQV